MNTVTGLAETLQRLSNYAQETRKKASQDIIETAYEIHEDSTQAVPVDLGNLKQSGFVEVKSELDAEITYNADYAPFVEFGTGGEVKVPSGWGEFAMQFKGKGIKTINAPAQPFLIPAYEKGVKKLKTKLSSITTTNRAL